MLPLLLILQHLTAQLVQVESLPVPLALRATDNSDTVTSCSDINNCRTVWDIVWSCLATVISCTWVAIHPNIPAPYDSSVRIALRRTWLVLLALIAPELVIVWAMRQWLIARKFSTKYREYGWTQAHGFFALMGGFMLFDGPHPSRTLIPDELEPHLHSGEIDISHKEVNDRSKGDVLSKGLLIIQTGWFVLQCFARVGQHLPLTELELVTLAFAILNLATYALWWSKPLNVECAFGVMKEKRAYEQKAEEDEQRAAANFEVEVQERTPFMRMSNLERWKLITLPLAPFLQMAGMADEDGELPSGSKSVPTFYAGTLLNEESAYVFCTAVVSATVFGAIHCIAWSFQFPTRHEQILWRLASLFLTCAPVAGVFVHLAVEERSVGARNVGFMVVVGLMVLYIFARVTLLIQAFISLRLLPPAVFQEVDWTTYFPHI